MTGVFGRMLSVNELPSKEVLAEMHAPVSFKPTPVEGDILSLGGFFNGPGWGHGEDKS